jgi:serine/threonine protein kinase
VVFVKQDDQDADDSPLWPSAADGSSGLRDKRTVIPDVGSGVQTTRTTSASEAESDRVSLGQDTAPYQLLTPIGSTAYGRAFRARHMGQQREVALHFLTLADDGEGTLARALPLAVAKCAQLSHPNVIALEEHGRAEGDGSTYLVTEPLEGVSLEAQLADAGVLSLSRALTITLQIGRALRAAHKLGIVHGALTPANVRLLRNERSELVRVVGFGTTMLSPRHPLPEAGPDSPHSPYLAPECARGGLPDTRSDVFAVGALLFRMLTGRAPVTPQVDPASPARGASASLPEPQSVAAYSMEPIPRELDELVGRCLEADPERRLSDLVELMRDLRAVARSQHVADDGPTTGSEISLAPPDVPPAESDASGSIFGSEATGRRGAAWIIAGLMLALAAVWLVWEASTRVRPEAPEQQRRGRSGEKEGDDNR